MSVFIRKFFARRADFAAYQNKLPAINRNLGEGAAGGVDRIQARLMDYAQNGDPDALLALKNMGVDVSGIGAPTENDFNFIAQQRTPLHCLTRHITDRSFRSRYVSLVEKFNAALRERPEETATPREKISAYTAMAESFDELRTAIRDFATNGLPEQKKVLYRGFGVELTLETLISGAEQIAVAESQEPSRREVITDLRAYLGKSLSPYYYLLLHEKVTEIIDAIQSADSFIEEIPAIIQRTIIDQLPQILSKKNLIAKSMAVLEVQLPVFKAFSEPAPVAPAPASVPVSVPAVIEADTSAVVPEPVYKPAEISVTGGISKLTTDIVDRNGEPVPVDLPIKPIPVTMTPVGPLTGPLQEVPTEEDILPQEEDRFEAEETADRIISEYLFGNALKKEEELRDAIVMLLVIKGGKRKLRKLLSKLGGARRNEESLIVAAENIIKTAADYSVVNYEIGRRQAGSSEDFLARAFPERPAVAGVLPPPAPEAPIRRRKTPVEAGRIPPADVEKIKNLINTKISSVLSGPQTEGLRYAASALLQGHIPSAEVVGSTDLLSEEFDESWYTLSALCNAIKTDFPNLTAQTIEELNAFKDNINKTELVSIIERKNKQGLLALAKEETEFIDRMKRKEKLSSFDKRRLLEIRYPATFPKNRLGEEKDRVYKLASQIAKYGEALKRGTINRLELNINAPTIDPSAIDALLKLIPPDFHDRVKIYQRANPIPERNEAREKVSGRKLIYDGSKQSVTQKEDVPEAKKTELPEVSRVFSTSDLGDPRAFLINLTAYCGNLAKRMERGEIGGVTLNFQGEHISHKTLRRLRRIFGRHRKKVKVFIRTGVGEEMKRISLGKPMREKKAFLRANRGWEEKKENWLYAHQRYLSGHNLNFGKNFTWDTVRSAMRLGSDGNGSTGSLVKGIVRDMGILQQRIRDDNSNDLAELAALRTWFSSQDNGLSKRLNTNHLAKTTIMDTADFLGRLRALLEKHPG